VRADAGALAVLGLVLTTRLLALWQATVARKRLTGRIERQALGFLAACLAMLALADAWVLGWRIWTGEPPLIPSLAELFVLAAYMALVSFLIVFPAPLIERFGRARTLLDVLILSLSVFTLAWVAFVQPISGVGLAPPTRLAWLALAPVFDLILLGLCLRQVLLYAGRKEARAFAAFGAGLTLLTLGDLAHTTNSLLGEPRWGLFIGAGAIVANLVVGWGARLLPATRHDPRERTSRTALAWRLEALLPIALTFIVVGFTVFNWWSTTAIDWLAVGASVLLSLLVGARQGVVAGQRELRQHAALVNAAADMAFVVTTDGKMLLANPALTHALGRPEAASDLALADFLHAAEDVPAVLRRAHASGWSGEATVQTGAAGAIPVLLTLSPVPQGQQGPPMLAGIAHDLTAIKERERALRAALADVAAARAELQILNEDLELKVKERTQELEQTVADLARLNEELKALDELKTEFVSLVSHELRAPLTNIRTGIELLLGGGAHLPQGAEETLALVQGEARRLTRFVETILDVSALEAGKFSLRLKPVDLRMIARNAVAGFSDAQARARIRLAIPDSMNDLTADEAALQSVLFHLLDNALKYAPEGEIEVSAEMQPGIGQVRVRDHGSGIPDDDDERIFDIFHRLDSRDSREVYGHGLGLHLVRRLLEAMNGGIRAEHPPGGGLCMLFWLPAASDPGQVRPGS